MFWRCFQQTTSLLLSLGLVGYCAPNLLAQNTDLKLDSLEFQRRYTQQWKSLDGLIRTFSQSRQAFGNPQNLRRQLWLLSRIADFLPNPKACQFFFRTFQQVQENQRLQDPSFWKIQALIFKTWRHYWASFSETIQVKILQYARNTFSEPSIHPRLLVACGELLVVPFALEASFSLEDGSIWPGDGGVHPYKVARLLAERMLTFSDKQAFLAFGFAHIFRQFQHPLLATALRVLRKKPFPRFVLNAIAASLKSFEIQ